MECLHPVRVIDKAAYGGGLVVPCGKCIVCRRRRSLEWVQRIQDELTFHDEAVFLTLTYDAQHLPYPGTLRKRDVQSWLKRFRKALEPTKVRYFLCGEYGDKFSRPHYHAIVFGVGPDCEDTVSSTWSMGLVHTGTVSEKSIAYVAAYCTKKLGSEFYGRRGVIPPFLLMSRRPGIGAGMCEKNRTLFEQGFCWRGTYKAALPRYYIKRVFCTPELVSRREKQVLDNRRRSLLELSTAHGDVYAGLDAEKRAVKAKALEILARMRLKGRMS